MKTLLFGLSILIINCIACKSDSNNKKTKQKESSVNTGYVTQHPGIPKRICIEMTPTSDTLFHELYAGILSAYRWKWAPGQQREIRVRFIDGMPEIQERVKSIARQWEPYINARFIFTNHASPQDISISFAKRGVSWSYIGTDSKRHVPSMNFGWLEEEQVDSLFQAVVLHEFGHAIGLVHEHQLPNGNPIKWNVPAVYRFYMNPPNNWSVQEVDENIFARYAQNQLIGGSYDPYSIMIYHIPDSLTIDGYSTPLNVRLSVKDKKLVTDAYLR